jgi:16S rRNA (cytosine967-C5)-methyltransferase
VAALRICEELRNGALLDIAFERYASVLDARNRRWLQQLVYGMLRTRSRLDAIADVRVNGGIARLNPTLLDLLRLGTYQLLHMGGVPPYAAIAQTVELSKERQGMGAGKLVNAVMRRIDREREELYYPTPADPMEALGLEYSHPAWLVSRWADRFGIIETQRLLELNNVEPYNYVRPYNTSSPELVGELKRAGAFMEHAPIVEGSSRLSPGVTVGELGAFRRGWFFVQDPAATLVTEYAAVEAGSIVADLCAAPGGKTFELSRAASLVLAEDRSLQRLTRMKENLARLRATNVALVAADAALPPFRPVDAVLLDAPCTGTGTFRRHPDARWRLKISDIAVLAAEQRNLLRAAAELVRPGGLLVYSTCSIEPEENDAQIDWLLAEQGDGGPIWSLEPPPAGAVPDVVLDNGRLRVLPQRHHIDGSFAARLRKRA